VESAAEWVSESPSTLQVLVQHAAGKVVWRTYLDKRKDVPTQDILSDPFSAVPMTGAAVATEVWSMNDTINAIPWVISFEVTVRNCLLTHLYQHTPS
jgi:hypothetical protein